MTGALFDSPVPPGTGWPGDPAGASTPVAASVAEVRSLARSSPDLAEVTAQMLDRLLLSVSRPS